MTTINPCKVLRTGDIININNVPGIIHYLYDKNGKLFFYLPFRLIDHAQVKIKDKVLNVYPYQMQILKGEKYERLSK